MLLISFWLNTIIKFWNRLELLQVSHALIHGFEAPFLGVLIEVGYVIKLIFVHCNEVNFSFSILHVFDQPLNLFGVVDKFTLLLVPVEFKKHILAVLLSLSKTVDKSLPLKVVHSGEKVLISQIVEHLIFESVNEIG